MHAKAKKKTTAKSGVIPPAPRSSSTQVPGLTPEANVSAQDVAIHFGTTVRNAAVVTKSDVTDIAAKPTLGLYVGTTGDITAKMQDGSIRLFKAVPVGFFPVNVLRVNATASTAADILALYA